MRSAIEHSCNAYFWSMGLRPTPRKRRKWSISRLRREVRPAHPITALRHHAQPRMAGEKYHREWQGYDHRQHVDRPGLCAGQPDAVGGHAGAACVREAAPAAAADGRAARPIPGLAVDPEHLKIIREGMTAVVNGGGTAVASRLPLDGIQMAGKTGTAQVFSSSRADTKAIGICATTPCSSPSPRPTSRAMRSAASSSTAGSARRPPHPSCAIR